MYSILISNLIFMLINKLKNLTWEPALALAMMEKKSILTLKEKMI